MTPPVASVSTDLDGDLLDQDELAQFYIGPNPEWTEEAACVGRTDLFFGIAGGRHGSDETRLKGRVGHAGDRVEDLFLGSHGQLSCSVAADADTETDQAEESAATEQEG